MTVALVAVPVLAGLVLWTAWSRRAWSAAALAAAATAAGTATLALAVAVLVAAPRVRVPVGVGLAWTADVPPVAGAMAVLVAAVAVPVTAYAAVHEERRTAPRVVGLLLCFIGAMQLLVVAGDLFTLLVGWELVGAVSWGLIATEWREPGVAGSATTAFLVTRAGDLGLFVAVGAAVAGAGGVGYADLATLDGAALHAAVAGILLAAASKGAQVPFAPWLDAAMAGPTPASALLHSATMVAAGPFLLVRLSEVLSLASWFGPTAVTIGLLTAVVAGAVATTRTDAKRLLAASTSAQVGFMVVAVGVGAPLVGFAHLVAHAGLKALLFLAGGVAITAAGTRDLSAMRLGRVLPGTAVLAGIGTAALAAVWPLGAAWTKEHVVAAAGEAGAALALGVVVAGAISAAYAVRWWLLAFGLAEQPDDNGPEPSDGPGSVRGRGPHAVERAGVAALAALTLGMSVLWWPPAAEAVAEWFGAALPTPTPAETAASLGAVVVAAYGTWALDRRGRLAGTASLPALTDAPAGRRTAGWLGLPELAEHAATRPTLATATALARLDDRVVDAGVDAVGRSGARVARRLAVGDDRVVDAGVRAVGVGTDLLGRVLAWAGEAAVDGVVRLLAWGVGQGGRDARRVQTGMTHHYYVVVVVGLAALVVVTVVG